MATKKSKKEKIDFIKDRDIHRDILDCITQAVIVTDLKGKIKFWNKFASKLYGWQQNEVLGKNIVTVTPSKMSKKQAQDIMKSLEKGKSWQGEFEVQRKNKSKFLAYVQNSPLFDSNNKLIGIVGVSYDITAMKKNHEELEKKMGQLKKTNKLMIGRELQMLKLKSKIEKLEKLKNK